MATIAPLSSSASLSQAAAHQLQASAKRQISERIFDEALSSVKQSRKDASGKGQRSSRAFKRDEELLDQLATAHGDLAALKVLEHQREESAILGPNAKIKTNGKFQKILSQMLAVEPLVNKLVNLEPTIAAPVWGVLCFFFVAVSKVPSIAESIEEMLEQISLKLEAYKEYFMDSSRLAFGDSSLRRALRRFYITLIEVALDISPLLRSLSRGVLHIVDGSAKTDVEGLQKKVERAADWVQECGINDQMATLRDKVDTLGASQSQGTMTSSNTISHRVQLSVSQMLNPHFAGRDAVLQTLTNLFATTSVHGEPRKVALCGIPGIGKTQTAIAFAQRAASDPSAPNYAHTMLIRARDTPTLQSNLLQLALRVCGISISDPAGESAMIKRFKSWLEDTPEKWLLVIDDVADTNVLIDFLPSNGKGDIIYTARGPEAVKILCGSKNVIEVGRMSQDESRRMLLSVLRDSVCVTSEADRDEAIKQIAAFCDGLPLSMEQLVRNADNRGVSWRDVLAEVKQKVVLLKQKSVNGFHFDDRLADHSTGAILMSALEGLRDKDAMASALFPVLAYFEPSSIPTKMLLDGAGELDDWFDRPTTYDRGSTKTPEGEIVIRNAQSGKRANYQPTGSAKADFQGRLRHFLRNATSRQDRQLPRIDSKRDTSLRSHWEDSKALKLVLSEKTQLTAAINVLVDSGLVRRINSESLWIHDLFAELTTALLESASNPSQSPSDPTTGQPNADALQTMHLSATLVFLAFPIIRERFEVTTACLELLPHAETTLKHLSDANILADATVGAELSHIAGCASNLKVMRMGIEMRTRTPPGENYRMRGEASLNYFRMAYTGYSAAAKRLVEHLLHQSGPTRVTRLIGEAVRYDYELEELAHMQGAAWRYYSPESHHGAYERFGCDPVRRRLDCLLKLGGVYGQAGRYDEAARYLEMAVQGYALVLGLRHRLTEYAREALQNAYQSAERWVDALDVIGERYRVWLPPPGSEGHPGVLGPGDLILDVATFSTPLVQQAADCLGGLGRYDDAAVLYEVVFTFVERQSGKNTVANIPRAKALAVAHGRSGRWKECMFWWCVVFGLVFGAEDGDDVIDEGDGGVDVGAHLQDDGWWLKDTYLAAARGIREELQMWEYALGQWRQGLSDGDDDGRRGGLQALVGKTERDLDVWRRRVAEMKRREKEREERELRIAMGEDVVVPVEDAVDT